MSPVSDNRIQELIRILAGGNPTDDDCVDAGCALQELRDQLDLARAGLEAAKDAAYKLNSAYESAVKGRQQFRASFMASRRFAERYQRLRDCEDGTFAVFMPRVYGHIAFQGEALDHKIDEYFGLAAK